MSLEPYSARAFPACSSSTILCPIKDVEIKELLKRALTSDINNRDVYMKGIDASFSYEGYFVYKMSELV